MITYGAALQGRPQRLHAALGAGERVLWCLLLLLALLVRSEVADGPELGNDTYQYLSAARNLLRGEGAATSIAHFDAERSHGRIPAPLTTFPAGYPALIALLAAAGMGAEQAGALLSLVAAVAIAAMLPAAAGLLGVPAATVRVLLLLLVSSSAFLAPGNHIASEAPFTALTFGALLLLLAAEQRARTERAYIALQLGANALIAAAFCVRYAGLFLFAALLAFHAWRSLSGGARRERRARLALAAMALSALPVGATLWRNHVLIGSWKGGNEKAADNPLVDVLYRFAQSIHHLFLGDAPARFGTAEAALALALGAIALAALPALWRRRAALLADARMQLIAVFLVVYACAMVYLGARSVISFGPRMFVPLLPVLLLYAGGLWRYARPPQQRPALRAAAALLVLAYAAVNLPVLLSAPGLAPHQRVQARLESPLPSGRSLRALLERELAPHAALLATDGQATGYVLQRNTVSLAPPVSSEAQWTEEAVLAAMRRFGARHLLVYPGETPSAFLAALARGAPPAWLELRADNGQALLFVRPGPD